MTDSVHDPVHHARHSFRPEGDDLVVDTWLEPGGVLPPHFHPRQTEVWSVVEGEVRLQVGKEKRVITPADGGQTVGPDTVHGLQSSSDETAHLRCHVSPALGLQGFLTESAEAANEGLFMKGGIPKNLKGARWAARFLDRYGADVVMVSPPRFAQRAMVRIFA